MLYGRRVSPSSQPCQRKAYEKLDFLSHRSRRGNSRSRVRISFHARLAIAFRRVIVAGRQVWRVSSKSRATAKSSVNTASRNFSANQRDSARRLLLARRLPRLETSLRLPSCRQNAAHLQCGRGLSAATEYGRDELCLVPKSISTHRVNTPLGRAQRLGFL